MTTNNAYIQGFMNKCAEYGVNPHLLAMRARARGMQKMSAGEYAGAVPPKSVADIGTKDIPAYRPDIDSGYASGLDDIFSKRRVGWYRHDDRRNAEIGRYPGTLVALETGAVDPKWWAAHTNASAKAIAPLWRFNDNDTLPEHIRQAVIKNYHNYMLSQTGMPARVSSPVRQAPSPLQGASSRIMQEYLRHNLFDKKPGLTR